MLLLFTALVVSIGAVAAVYRRELLTVVGEQLIITPHEGEQTHLLLVSGDRVEEVAVEYLQRGIAEHCLVFAEAPSRVVQLGVLPSPVELRIAEIRKEGIPEHKIGVLTVESGSDWGRRLERWLQKNDRTSVLVLCDQFSSRQLRIGIDDIMDPALSRRIRVAPIRDRRYDESNWWRSRLGIRHVCSGYISLATHYLLGEPEEERPYRTPDEYEQWFLESLPCGHSTRFD